MTRLTDIIEINISRETAAVAQTNFNIPLFISAHTNFKERARVYSSLLAVATDFAPTDSAYIAATKLFGQELVPSKIVIGRRQVPGATVSVGTVTIGATYTMTVNDQAYNYVAIAADTAIKIATGLKNAYNVTPQAGVGITDNLDGTVTLAASVDWSLKVSSNLTKTAQLSVESWATAGTAVAVANNTWYAAAIESHVTADVLAFAAWIEGQKKIFGTSSAGTDIKTSVTTDLFSQLKALGYQRTFGIYSATANTEFPECALIGYQLQEQPGSNTWEYKTLSGVSVSAITDTESTNIKTKSGLTYESIGGASSTVNTKMFGGEWIDVMVFVDWFQARMTERLWFRMKNSKKIPYTDAGAAIIESEIRAQLNDGIRAGGLATSPAPTVTIPPVLAVSPNLRAQRIFEGIKFEARLAGAIHFVKIAGTVTV